MEVVIAGTTGCPINAKHGDTAEQEVAAAEPGESATMTPLVAVGMEAPPASGESGGAGLVLVVAIEEAARAHGSFAKTGPIMEAGRN